MSENPYRLAKDIRRIGFRTADLIAGRLGIEKTAMIRVHAGISFALTEAMNDGHCGFPRAELAGLAEKLLEVPANLIESAMAHELAEGTVTADRVGETKCLFLTGLYQAERSVAEHLSWLSAGSLPWPEIDADRALPWIEQKTGLTLATSQAEAIRFALRSKLLVITGGPGVGKTTIVNSILRILAVKGTRILLCAPTGRTAKRMAEATGMEARTIHRLLEFDPKACGFERNDENRLDCDLLVIDESSMVDVSLMQSLLKAAPSFAGLLNCGRYRPVAICRTGAGSRRHHWLRRHPGRAVDGGIPPGHAKQNHHQCAPDQPGTFAGFIIDGQGSRLLFRAGRGFRTSRVAHRRAGALQKVERFGWTFAPGDKVMQVENDYDKEVYNGDIGLIGRVDLDDGEVIIGFDGRSVIFPFGELDTIVLAYAATIHKAQGSEYPAVVIPVMTQHYAMLQRNLLYTGVTCGKRLVVLVGQEKAVAIAVKNIAGRRRWSKLTAWLVSE